MPLVLLRAGQHLRMVRLPTPLTGLETVQPTTALFGASGQSGLRIGRLVRLVLERRRPTFLVFESKMILPVLWIL